MTTRVTLDDITSHVLGWSCDQCGQTFVYIEGAMMHQGKIWDCKGRCPDAPEKEADHDPS